MSIFFTVIIFVFIEGVFCNPHVIFIVAYYLDRSTQHSNNSRYTLYVVVFV